MFSGSIWVRYYLRQYYKTRCTQHVKLFVYHTPELTPADKAPDCAIAVDVLRATSTMATVLAAGGEAIQVFSDLEKLMHVSESWLPEKRLRAGERGGGKVPGVELGNSPLDCTPELVHGRRLFIPRMALAPYNESKMLQLSSPQLLSIGLRWCGI